MKLLRIRVALQCCRCRRRRRRPRRGLRRCRKAKLGQQHTNAWRKSVVVCATGVRTGWITLLEI